MGETIIVYGRESCPACENTMRALTIAGVPARYVDVDGEPAAAEMLRVKLRSPNPPVPAGKFH